MQNKDRIERFIKRYAWDEKNPCNKLVLRHISAGNKIGNEIREFELSKGLTFEDIEAMCNEVEQVAQDDTEGIGGHQKYALLVYRKDKDNAYSRLIIAISNEGNSEIDDTLDSEPPTTKGIVTQLMRHNEAIMRAHTMGITAVLQAQQRTITRQSEQLEHLSDKHFEAISLVEELVSAKHDRELENKKLDIKLDMQKEAFGNAKMLMPAIVNKIAGKKILKEKVTPQQMLLKQLVDSIKPDQIGKLMESFTPQQKIAFMELYQSLNDDDVTEHGEVKKNSENSSENNSNNGVNSDAS